VVNRIDFGAATCWPRSTVRRRHGHQPAVRATDEWRALPPELAEYEPRVAFDGGPDGLTLIRRLLRDAPSHLRRGGALFAEISYDQAEEVLALVDQAFPEALAESRKDLANLDRVLCVYS
jgi:methylase of polypeptide subunit release factors